MWKDKNGYSTFLLANEASLSSKGSQIELVRFFKGKYKHYHKIKTESFYYLKGNGHLILDGKKINIQPGKFIVIPPRCTHEWINKFDEPLEALMIKTNNSLEDTYID